MHLPFFSFQSPISQFSLVDLSRLLISKLTSPIFYCGRLLFFSKSTRRFIFLDLFLQAGTDFAFAKERAKSESAKSRWDFERARKVNWKNNILN